MTPKLKTAFPATTTVRLRPEDHDLIEKLLKKTGASNTTEIIRMGLRALANKEKV